MVKKEDYWKIIQLNLIMKMDILISLGLYPAWTVSNINLLHFNFEGIPIGLELIIGIIKIIKL